MTDELVERLADLDPILETDFDTQLGVERDPYGATKAIEKSLYLLRDQAARIEQLTAERDEAINQLDSAIHSVIVLEKRVAAVMEDRRFILEERDRTFAVMLARAEKAEAEADNARLQKALTDAGAYLDKGQDKMAFNVIRAALKGETP